MTRAAVSVPSGGGRPGKGSDSCGRSPRGVSAAVCTVYIGIISQESKQSFGFV